MKLKEALLVGLFAAGCHGERSDEVVECQMSYDRGLDDAYLNALRACTVKAEEKGENPSYCIATVVVSRAEVDPLCEEYPDSCENGVIAVCDYLATKWIDLCGEQAESTGYSWGCFQGLTAYFDACYEAAEAECRYLLG